MTSQGGTIPTARGGTILTAVLRSHRRSLLLWALAVSAVAALYTLFYPSIGAEKMEVLLESMPPELVTAMGFDSLATAEGYVTATVYSLLGAVLTLVLAIGLGARLVAGQEEDGTLELELGAPVSRARIYAERLAALWLGVLVLALVLSTALVLLSTTLELGLDPLDVLAASTGLLFFGGALGTVAFSVGAASGRRGPALGTAAALAVVSYVLSYLGPLVKAPWMERLSPFHWYIGAEPLETGFDLPGLALLAALATAAAMGGALAFVRRDVMV
ncbi:ABC transporter permease subunit [Kocuria sp. M1R5S2]|uniref:ABC transporter permease subunit n=1 Tax=Kocuria rhizosphaerae TaxID=3376285 RepID=UPI003793F859